HSGSCPPGFPGIAKLAVPTVQTSPGDAQSSEKAAFPQMWETARLVGCAIPILLPGSFEIEGHPIRPQYQIQLWSQCLAPHLNRESFRGQCDMQKPRPF